MRGACGPRAPGIRFWHGSTTPFHKSGYNECVNRAANRTRDAAAERELAFEMRGELTCEDRTFLKAVEAVIDEHSELFELLAQE